MSYFLSPALATLRAEINALWPHRDKTSDGWIGDASHQARPSDHNPAWNEGGIVRATDTDEDLAAGLAEVGAAMPLVNAIIRDPRVAYLIYEGRIWQNPAVYRNGGWRPYTGVNAHRHHVHVSVRHGARWDLDSGTWNLASRVSNELGGTGAIPQVPNLNAPTPIEEDDMFTDDDRAQMKETLALLKEQQTRNVRALRPLWRADMLEQANKAVKPALDRLVALARKVGA